MSDQVGVLEAFHVRLTTPKGKVGVALNAVHRRDPARAELLLRELQDLRAHRVSHTNRFPPGEKRGLRFNGVSSLRPS